MIVRARAMGPIESNCYVVAAEPGGVAVVIDPCWDDPWILETVRELGARVVALLNTHGHFDHVAGINTVKRATGAVTYMHPADADIAAAAPDYAAILVGAEIEAPPPADRSLADGERLEFGTLSFEVLETPGHSPGGVCFRAGDEAIFTGDTLFRGSVGRTDNPEGDQEALMRSIRIKLMGLPDGMRVYPGHGEATTIGREKRENPFLQGLA